MAIIPTVRCKNMRKSLAFYTDVLGLEEVRRLRAFETPTQKTRRKAKANAKRGRTKFRFNPS